MAHQIETHGSEAAALLVRTDAWHTLDTRASSPSTRRAPWADARAE